MQKKYIISEHTLFDEDKMLYETYVGLNNKEMTLICSAFGKNETESRQRANDLAEILTAHYSHKVKPQV